MSGGRPLGRVIVPIFSILTLASIAVCFLAARKRGPECPKQASSEEVRALQRSSSALQTEMRITTRARTHEPAWNCGRAAKERRIRAPLRYPAPCHGFPKVV
jgi:hypothetical protein